MRAKIIKNLALESEYLVLINWEGKRDGKFVKEVVSTPNGWILTEVPALETIGPDRALIHNTDTEEDSWFHAIYSALRDYYELEKREARPYLYQNEETQLKIQEQEETIAILKKQIKSSGEQLSKERADAIKYKEATSILLDLIRALIRDN